jgi:hypothetical protein
MHPTDLASAGDCHWAIVRFAVVSSGLFVAWLIAFERWIEPLLRRCTGAILGCRVFWAPVGASFRIWGLLGAKGSATDAAVSLVGTVVLQVCAAVPVVLVRLAARWMGSDAMIGEITYLMAVPTMMLFVLRVLTRGVPAEKP